MADRANDVQSKCHDRANGTRANSYRANGKRAGVEAPDLKLHNQQKPKFAQHI